MDNGMLISSLPEEEQRAILLGMGISIPKGVDQQVEEDLHLSEVAHSEDAEKRKLCAERGLDALRHDNGEIFQD